MAAFGGRRLPVRRGGRTYANVDYRDRYDNAMYWPSYALRAVAHYEGPAIVDGSNLDEYRGPAGGSLSKLIESRKPLEVLFTEDFDPSGRVFEAKGSFSQWPAVAQDRAIDGIDGHARPVLSTEPGHANGVLLIDRALTIWADDGGAVHPVMGEDKCRAFGGYVDKQGKLFVICGSTVEAADGSKVVLQAPRLFLGFPEEEPHYKSVGLVPPVEGQWLLNPDAIAVDRNGRLGILRFPSGAEPSTVDDPAWWFGKDAPPVELAPWSTLQLATSTACTHSDDGVRAIVQTPLPWVTVAGSSGFDGTRKFPEQPGMKAIVRWSKARVCLEAIELGYRGVRWPGHWRYPVTDVMLAARFVGRDSGAGLVAFNSEAAYQETVSCKLLPAPR
jgi:hypothetical protein